MSVLSCLSAANPTLSAFVSLECVVAVVFVLSNQSICSLSTPWLFRFDLFLRDPFPDVLRASEQRYPVALAPSQKPDGFQVYKRKLFEIERHRRSALINQRPQILQMMDLHSTDQPESCSSAVAVYFNFPAHFQIGRNLVAVAI